MNFTKPLFFAFILLSTSLIGCVKSVNSQVTSSKASEVAVASGQRRSKISASREIKQGWKNFQANGIELQLPSYYEGGNTKQNSQAVLERIEKAGIPSDLITNTFQIQDYELFAINPKEVIKGNISYIEVRKEELPASIPLQFMTDKFAEGVSQTGPNIVEKKVVSLDNYQAGKVVFKVINPQTNQVQGIGVSYLFEENQDFWAVTYVTSSESQLQKQLPVFEESASTFRITGKS
ncbi:hypothetical protein NIES267_06950 [Calothrix parasitica NIES-267]|uniref:Lipoprotein n=1 Tax=Calothrix parasitica NIES-267 TaxID=1973488 RepID=A0A1Z4LIZ8_9CYAN|nr:hypothetical protein NIES267_06950 [Calothrix parasitica NIES-267]